MISVMDALTDLERQAKELEQRRRFAKKCLQSWQGSLRAVAAQVFPLFPAAAYKAEEDWQQVHRCLQEDVAEDVLESTPRLVERVLHNYAQESRRSQREDLDAVKEILEVMSGTAASVRSRTANYSGSFEGACDSLGRLARLDNAEELRRQLSAQAKQLRASVEQMVRDSEAALTAMEADLHHFRKRLAKAESAASTDPLTGLANRRKLEQELEARILRKTPFCALLIDLDQFKSINDRFGHECGDQVLRQFAKVLHENVRPGDVAARWGGDEFFVIINCSMKEMLRRGQQISAELTRRYEIKWTGKRVMIPIQASSGVVEFCSGETAAELFRRADQAMYALKEKAAVSRRD